MVYFHTKNPDLGKFRRVLQWKMSVNYVYAHYIGLFYDYLVYFVAIWYILWPFGIFCGHLAYLLYVHLVYFSRFGMLDQEKSGNPDWLRQMCSTDGGTASTYSSLTKLASGVVA
jgi:hypothetical protein